MQVREVRDISYANAQRVSEIVGEMQDEGSAQLLMNSLRKLQHIIEEGSFVIRAESESETFHAVVVYPMLLRCDMQLQRAAMELMLCMMRSKEPALRDSASHLVKAKALPLVLNAMSIHREIASVQELVLDVLSQMAVEVVSSRSKLGRNGCIDHTVETMTLHLHNAVLQYKGCCLLRALLPHTDNQEKMRHEGGMAAVIRAMQVHPQNLIVQRFGCCSLSLIVYNHEDIQREVAGMDGIRLVLVAMLMHPEDEEVATYACAMIKNISSTNSNMQALTLELGGHDIIARVLQKWRGSSKVQNQGLPALRWLNSEQVKRMRISSSSSNLSSNLVS